MARHIVCLTFDFDVMSGHIAREMTTPTPISRGEFGIVGAGRVLSLLKAEEIATTWFVPGFTIETYPNACAQVVEGGHEIGHHGWTHVQPALLEREQEEAEMIRSMGCTKIQGFHFGRPMPRDDVAGVFTRRAAEQRLKSA